jgi:Gram-negative porin
MPLKSLEGTNGVMWGEGDLVEVMVHGKGTTRAVPAFANVHTRQKSVLLYTSPKLLGAVVAKLAYSPDEGKGAGTAPAVTKPVSGFSLEYNDGTWNAGVATQSAKNVIGTAPATTTMKGTKFIAGAKMGVWSTGLAYSTLDNGAGRETKNWALTGSYGLGVTTLKASFGKSGESSAGADDSISGVALQADYALDKQTTVYGSFTRLSNGAAARARFEGSDGFPAVNAGTDPRALGVGIRYNF